MNTNINNQLKDLKIEDLIWITYLFLAIAALLSNYYEKQSLFNKNQTFNQKSKNINITIFTITFFIYLYFAYINYRDLKKIKKGLTTGNNRIILINQARLIAAILFLVGGAIYLFTETQRGTEEEIGFI